MKVLWVEDHPKACEMLLAAGASATRQRLPVDLVLAGSLMEAEKKLRLERFDLVMLDLRLPDSMDEDTTVTRVASMGDYRIGVVSASEKRQSMVDFLCKVGSNCSPKAIAKEDLALNEFSRYPDKFYNFLLDVMGENDPEGAAA